MGEHISTADSTDDWRQWAECRGADPAIFYPSERNDEAACFAAKLICNRCIVRETCLEYALDNDETDGVWGGTSPYSRKKLKKARLRG